MKGEAKAIKAPKPKKKRRTWSKETRVDDLTERVSVEELDNGGFLVVVNKYGNKKNGEYFDESNKYFSEDNPLEPVEEEPVEEKVFNSLIRTVK